MRALDTRRMEKPAATLVDVASGALRRLDVCMRAAFNCSPNASQYGHTQAQVAEASAFNDAVLAALRARFAEIHEVAK